MEEFIKVLSDDYGFNVNYINKIWNVIKDLRIVQDSDIEYQQDCLEAIIFDKVSFKKNKKRTIKQSIIYGLCDTYGADEIIDCIPETFLYKNIKEQESQVNKKYINDFLSYSAKESIDDFSNKQKVRI